MNRILWSLLLLTTLSTVVSAQSLTTTQAATPPLLNLPQLQQLAEQLNNDRINQRQQTLSRAGVLGLPIRRNLATGAVIELEKFEHDRPRYLITTNLMAADTLSTDEVWTGGNLLLNLSGAGQTLGIWDGGNVLASHQELSGAVINLDTSPNNNHATHVAGTMIADGINPSAKGMSYGAQLRAYDFNGDTSEIAAEQLLTDAIVVSNHSYSFIGGWINNFFNDGLPVWFGDVAINSEEDWSFGFYDNSARDWDQIAFDSPTYTMVKAAGNDRGDNGSGTHWHFDGNALNFVLANDVHPNDGDSNGFDSISAGSAAAKNVITVGAAIDVPGGYLNPGDVNLASFSGRGPTDDGRIKPDLVGNGIGLTSSLAGSNNQYGSYSGTSMSTPNVAGSIGLLYEHATNLFATQLRASTIKSLILHSADEAGTAAGPDYEHGWGLMNTASAAQIMLDEANAVAAGHIFEIELQQGQTWSYSLFNDGSQPLKATIAWTDPPGTPPSPSVDPSTLMLVNDLDIRVVGPNNTIHQPWVLDPSNPGFAATEGDNFRDPVEQVFVDSPSAGNYLVTISHKNSLVGGSQHVSLVLTGNQEVNTGPPVFSSTPGTIGTVGVAYEYDADGRAEATGSQSISFSLGFGPIGLTIDINGLVSWTPTADQVGSHPVQLVANNAAGSVTQDFEITVNEPATGAVDLRNYTLSSYAGGQDGVGTVEVSSDGSSLTLTGNRWQSINLNYALTTNTVLEFNFESNQQGEVHGIGLAPNSNIDASRTFKLYGTQAWGIQDFNNYSGGAGIQTYSIPVGQFYTGDVNHLFFIMDHDVTSPSGHSEFSNIRIFEDVASSAPLITSTANTSAIVGQPYAYDTNNQLEASGNPTPNFSLISGPSNMTVTTAGIVNWVPMASQEGEQIITISAVNDNGVDSQTFTVMVAPEPSNDVINFNDYILGAYAGNQDGIGAVIIEDNGYALRLTGNRWQQIPYSYNVTADTVLEFTFASNQEGDVHGIGLSSNLTLDANRTFELSGTQVWGIQNYNDYVTGSGSKSYSIPVGQFYSGAMNHLFFVMDHDVSSPIGESIFSSIRVYEANQALTAPTITSTASTSAIVGTPYLYDSDGRAEAIGFPAPEFSLINSPSNMSISTDGTLSWTPGSNDEGVQTVAIQATNNAGIDSQQFNITVAPAASGNFINFNSNPPEPYAGSQDGTGNVSVENNGNALRLTGNRWQQIPINYTLTANTVIEFDFSSNSRGEIHGIGLDTDLNLSSDRTFHLYGSQLWGNQSFSNYSGSGIQHYVIPVGQFYTGFTPYLFFVMDNDGGQANSESLFSNIEIYEN